MTLQVDDPVVQFYLAEVAKLAPVSKAEEAALFERLHHGDNPNQETERRLIEGKLALVAEIAARYVSSEMPILELLEQGNNGLMKAVRTFAANPIGDFTSYACAQIEAEIQRAIAVWNESGRQ